jgi:predicted enzyme related to lactoylglutathione lyase
LLYPLLHSGYIRSDRIPSLGDIMQILRTGLLAGIGALMLLAAAATNAAARDPQETPAAKERVDGIGGFFFRAKSPKALAAWYADQLGISLTPTQYGQQPWRQTAGPTAFEPFPANTKYFERATQQFMLNFRVHDLDAMVAQLRRAGVKVDRDPTVYPNGLFASLHDPEGNPIQLWQPTESGSGKTEPGN